MKMNDIVEHHIVPKCSAQGILLFRCVSKYLNMLLENVLLYKHVTIDEFDGLRRRYPYSQIYSRYFDDELLEKTLMWKFKKKPYPNYVSLSSKNYVTCKNVVEVKQMLEKNVPFNEYDILDFINFGEEEIAAEFLKDFEPTERIFVAAFRNHLCDLVDSMTGLRKTFDIQTCKKYNEPHLYLQHFKKDINLSRTLFRQKCIRKVNKSLIVEFPKLYGRKIGPWYFCGSYIDQQQNAYLIKKWLLYYKWPVDIFCLKQAVHH